MQTGDMIMVGAEGRGWDIGCVEDIRPIGELPEIPGAPPVQLVNSIHREWGVKRVAVISHRGGSFVFVAMQIESGEWYDLHHQLLTIRPVCPGGHA